eukprot:gene8075-9935_t
MEEIVTMVDKVKNLIDAKTAELVKENEILKEERLKQEKIHQVVDLSQLPNYIVLNVGGKKYGTSRSTLTSIKNTYFHTMFSGTYELKPMEGTTNSYFIDRDGELILPDRESHKTELMKEINFYCLNEYLESTIEAKKEREYQELFTKINEWGSFPSNRKWKSIYQASKDGFSASTFHQKCNNKGPTITIIWSKTGNIFGGYTSLNWNSIGNYQNDPQSFLFLLKNSKNQSMKFPYRNTGHSIYDNVSYGPTFGNGHDFHICDNSNTVSNSYTNMNNSYGFQNTTGDPYILTGSNKFLVDEIQLSRGYVVLWSISHCFINTRENNNNIDVISEYKNYQDENGYIVSVCYSVKELSRLRFERGVFFKKQVHLKIQTNWVEPFLYQVDFDFVHRFQDYVYKIEISFDDYNLHLIKLLKQFTQLKKLVISIGTHNEEFTIPPDVLPDSVEMLDVSTMMSFEKDPLRFERVLKQNSIPPMVSNLVISHSLVRHDPHRLIPPSVTNLTLHRWSSFEGDVNLIPASVRTLVLVFPSKNAVISQGCLPDTLTDLDLGIVVIKSFNVIPKSVRKLKVEDGDAVYDFIPDSVQDLQIYYNGDRGLIAGHISNSVHTLELNKGFFYAKPLHLPPRYIPQSVTVLKAREVVNLVPILPDSLTYLECSLDRISLGSPLPQSLKTLKLCSITMDIEIGSLPNSLTKLVFTHSVPFPIVEGLLPKSLKKISFRQGVSLDTPFPVIPDSVTDLYFNNYKGRDSHEQTDTIPINSLPDSIIDLELISIKQPLLKKGILPKNIQSLIIEDCDYFFDLDYDSYYDDDDTSFNPIHSLQYLSLPSINSVIKQQQYTRLITHLFSNSTITYHHQLQIKIGMYTFLSLDFKDPYIYIKQKITGQEGFLLKSNITRFLRKHFHIYYDYNQQTISDDENNILFDFS